MVMLQSWKNARFSRNRSKAKSAGVLLAVLLLCCTTAGAQSTDRSTDALHKVNESVDLLIKKVSPRVVQILVTGYGPLEEGDRGSTSTVIGRQRAIGSGFVIEERIYRDECPCGERGPACAGGSP